MRQQQLDSEAETRQRLSARLTLLNHQLNALLVLFSGALVSLVTAA